MSKSLSIEKNILYVIIAVAAVIVIAVAYFAVSAQPSPKPSPAAAWKVGSFVEYKVVSQGNEFTMKYSVAGEEVYNGKDCYLLESTMISGNMKYVYTIWAAKADNKPVHARYRIYQDNNLVMEQEVDVQQAEEVVEQAKVSEGAKFLGYETITVPAGTFSCAKYEVETTQAGETYKSTYWVSDQVPIFKVVKSVTTKNGAVVTSMELINYGT